MYCRRYGVDLQDTLLGRDISPDGGVLVWTTILTYWLRWFEYVSETLSIHDIKSCPDDIKQDPIMFEHMIENHKQNEKNKNKGYGNI